MSRSTENHDFGTNKPPLITSYFVSRMQVFHAFCSLKCCFASKIAILVRLRCLGTSEPKPPNLILVYGGTHMNPAPKRPSGKGYESGSLEHKNNQIDGIGHQACFGLIPVLFALFKKALRRAPHYGCRHKLRPPPFTFVHKFCACPHAIWCGHLLHLPKCKCVRTSPLTPQTHNECSPRSISLQS